MTRRGVPEAKFYYGRLIKAALREVLTCLLRSGRFQEVLVIVGGCGSQGFVGRAAVTSTFFCDPFFLRGATLELQLDAGAFGQVRDRLDKGEGFELHHKLYGVPSFLATEAVVEVLFGRNAEGGGLLLVVRVGAEAGIVGPLAL